MAKLVSKHLWPPLRVTFPYYERPRADYVLFQFAKHIKMEEAVTFLNSNRTGIAVGTPVRLMDLLDNGTFLSATSSRSSFLSWYVNHGGCTG